MLSVVIMQFFYDFYVHAKSNKLFSSEKVFVLFLHFEIHFVSENENIIFKSSKSIMKTTIAKLFNIT